MLESDIGLDRTPYKYSNWAQTIGFKEEVLYRWSGSRMPKKSLLSDSEALILGSKVYLRRSEIEEPERRFLSHDVSIASSVSGRNTSCSFYSSVDGDEDPNIDFLGMRETLRVFDPGIDELDLLDDGKSCFLAFGSGLFANTTTEHLKTYLSSGTLEGLQIVRSAIGALSDGGYLLIDEIENHLSTQLVGVLIDLFQSAETNPNGASLVFTTHYPEVLDHVHRKDNVYFLSRDSEARLTRTVKYSKKVKRIENKKSEVFLSNYVGGTAPRYTDVQALRVLVKEVVANARR